MRQRMVPVVAVNHMHPAARGGFVVDGVAPPRGERQALAVAETYGVLDHEGLGLVVGVDIGLDEDEDAVTGHYLDIARHKGGVAVDIEAETAGTPSLEGDAREQHVAASAVVHPHLPGGGGHGGEDGVEADGVDREGQHSLVLVDIALALASRAERQQRNHHGSRHQYPKPFHPLDF